MQSSSQQWVGPGRQAASAFVMFLEILCERFSPQNGQELSSKLGLKVESLSLCNWPHSVLRKPQGRRTRLGGPGVLQPQIGELPWGPGWPSLEGRGGEVCPAQPRGRCTMD